MTKEPIYVLYYGDEVVGIGTAHELAKQRNVATRTIRYYASNQCRKRGGRIQAERVYV